MVRITKTVKSSRLNCSASSTHADASIYCADLDNWPRSWMGHEKDLPPGEALVRCFRPFIEHLAVAGLSRKTIRRHIDNLWSLGGELIHNLHDDPSLRKNPIDQVLRNTIHEDGGPMVHESEDEQRSFDSTCRKLNRFLSQSDH